MEDTDMPAFLAALNEMGVMFCDELTAERQRLYWEFFRTQITLEEWQYAANHAMWHETFHKVPLPAVLMASALEWRQAQREATQTPPPARQIREDLVSQEEVRKLLASIWPDERDRWAKDPLEPYEVEEEP